MTDFSSETMKAKRSWADHIQAIREHKYQPRILYPTNLSINLFGEIKIFLEKVKFAQYLSKSRPTKNNRLKRQNTRIETTP